MWSGSARSLYCLFKYWSNGIPNYDTIRGHIYSRNLMLRVDSTLLLESSVARRTRSRVHCRPANKLIDVDNLVTTGTRLVWLYTRLGLSHRMPGEKHQNSVSTAPEMPLLCHGTSTLDRPYVMFLSEWWSIDVWVVSWPRCASRSSLRISRGFAPIILISQRPRSNVVGHR